MKLRVKKIKVNGQVAYKYFKPKYCCNMLQTNPTIEIANEYPNNYSCCTECESENSKYDISNNETFGLFLTENVKTTDWEDTFLDTYYYPIKYCPFCGEKIEIEMLGSIDKTKEAEKIDSMIKELKEKIASCDSKKKCESLNKEIKALYNLSDYYYTTGEIDDNTEDQRETKQ